MAGKIIQRPPLKGVGRRLLHALLLLAGWMLFFWFWWHVVTTQEIDSRQVMLLIGGAVLLLPLLTLMWVLHNRNIFKLKGPRTCVRVVQEDYRADWEGRAVHADWAGLKSARVVTIEVDESGKHYRP